METLFLAPIAGDSIFIESDVWDMPTETEEDWAHAPKRICGPGRTDKAKIELEGAWDTSILVSGFEVDSEMDIISVSIPKVEGARVFILRDEFVVRSHHVRWESLQTLRGYMKHWLDASIFIGKLWTLNRWTCGGHTATMINC